ncbi:NYN domain-containing protein [Hephaestia mangrovi]|uniref:NYN domain-containing protein n=1 Tax=Hephaestia mangrovi TaxID=2873268 RepID=UPI001CA6390C|nr:NYN domain-containing protein [Hephaestia mangrovi]MBY8827212.1 NYN domain-containing protein [Hephaestia mangrovi]
MNGQDETRNVALLIDADNASPHALDPVLTVLAELGTVNIRRVYGNWRKQSLKSWADLTLKHGIEPHQQFDLTKGKNATDMKMTIDAMDLLFSGRVEGFGIMSSDSDFMPLAMRIRQDGIPVYGFGGAKTPEAFKQACTRFIDVAALTSEAKEEKPAPASTPTDEPRKSRAIDADLLHLLVDAYNAAKRDERGFVSLSELGRRAGNRSSFDARNYGFQRLSDLIEAVPNFQTERREGGATFVKRVH